MNRSLFVVAGLVAAALTASAQTPARDVPKPVPPPTGTSMLSGVVKDPDGAPVRRATVSISGDMHLDRLTIADDEGRFAFSTLPAGRFTITAEKSGYPQRSYGASRPYRTGSGVMLQDGQQVRDLVLTLAKGAVITGTVFDQRGEPMPHVPIMAWEVRTSLAGKRTLAFVGNEPETIITDDRGMYRVYGLPPGEYTVGTSWYYDGSDDLRVPTDDEIRAAFQNAQQAARTGTPAPQPPEARHFTHAPSFVPGVTDPLAAATFRLGPGEIREGVDLRMQFVEVSEVVATINSPDGGPTEVELTLTRRGPVEALNTMQDMPGFSGKEYRSGAVTPGPYTLTAQSEATGLKPAMWARAQVTVASGQRLPVSLVLQPSLSISGRVVFDGTSLTPPKDPEKVQMILRSASDSAEGQTETKVDAAGKMTVTGIIPGPYRVVGSISGAPATGPWWSIKSVVVDGRDVTDRPFDVDGRIQNLVVTFTDVTAEVTGTLTTPSGAPATDYFLIIMPADPTLFPTTRNRRLISTRPDRAGNYTFRRLPAGDYLIAVITDWVDEDLRDQSTLERLASEAGVKFTLTFGEKKTLPLRTAR